MSVEFYDERERVSRGLDMRRFGCRRSWLMARKRWKVSTKTSIEHSFSISPRRGCAHMMIHPLHVASLFEWECLSLLWSAKFEAGFYKAKLLNKLWQSTCLIGGTFLGAQLFNGEILKGIEWNPGTTESDLSLYLHWMQNIATMLTSSSATYFLIVLKMIRRHRCCCCRRRRRL